MKKIFAAGCVILGSAFACLGSIVPGDVAIVRVNNDVDGFSLLVLRDIAASESLFATDRGWIAAGGFRDNEGNGATDFITAGILKGSVIDVTAANVGTLALSASGDQIILFTGTLVSPGLVFAMDWGNASGWDADATSATTSADPVVARLADRYTVTLGSAAAYKYNGVTTGTPDQLLNLIADSANWVSTTDAKWSGGGFTVVPEPSTFIGGALLALPFGVQGVRYLRNRKRA